jgi:hypothetical protein
MAKYLVTIELITWLSREVEANSVDEAERITDTIYQEYQQGQRAALVRTELRRSVELAENPSPRPRWLPVGE